MARVTRCAAALLVTALLVAACGQSDASSKGDETSTTSDRGATRTASATGVTADTISLGYTQIDFDQLRSKFNVDLNYQNAQPVLDALVGELNDRGGINGRTVEATVGTYVPVGSASADALCIRFTEDQPVFAVLGGFGGLASDVNSCIAARHETALIGGTWTAAQHDDATAPWLRPDMTLARRSVGFAKALGEKGYLDDVDRIAIINSTAENEPFLPAVEKALEAGGSDVVLNATVSAAGGANEARTLLERAKAGGATAVYFSGLNPALYPALADFDFQYFFEDANTTEASLRDFFASGDTLDVVSNGTYPFPYRDDPEMAKCIDIVEARTEIVVEDPNTLPDDQPNWWEAVSRACQNLRLFEKVATAAGPNLNNDTFLAAAEKLGDVVLPGIVGSLGRDKLDANDTTRIVKWDPSAHHGDGGWKPVTKPFRVR